jgi:hypothetical protein
VPYAKGNIKSDLGDAELAVEVEEHFFLSALRLAVTGAVGNTGETGWFDVRPWTSAEVADVYLLDAPASAFTADKIVVAMSLDNLVANVHGEVSLLCLTSQAGQYKWL